MADFQDGFFRDLWDDVLFNESRSILCDYFREEKKQHILVKLKRYCLEAGGQYGPPLISFSMLLEMPELKKEKKRMEQHRQENPSYEAHIRFVGQLLKELEEGGKKEHVQKRSRRGSGENACVEILCRYYDLLQRSCAPKGSGGSGAALEFLEELSRAADGAKAGSRRRARAKEEIRRAKERILRGRAEPLVILERAASQVMDLYLYAEAVQFLYNAGYPMSTGEDGEEYGKDVRRPQKRNNSRIKTIPLKLLDFYFERRRITENYLTSVSRMPPSRISDSDVLREEIEEVYEFACANEMERAVIPLLTDNDSGSGLYILGKSYLHSWDAQAADYQKVQRILDGRPCCYAIVRFLNLELEDGGTYFWAPYSIVDPLYGKCDTNPEGVLFSDLETALDIYQGQLSVSSQEVLYENFRSENRVRLGGEDAGIDPQFLKYFQILEEEDELEDEKARLMEEYRRLLP